jgi:hypothetical protein
MNSQLRFARSIIGSANSAAAFSASHFFPPGQSFDGPPSPAMINDEALGGDLAKASGMIANAVEAGESHEWVRRNILLEGLTALKVQANLSRGLVLELIH